MNTNRPLMKQIPTTGPTTRKIMEGFALPDRSPPTENELDWIELIRVITANTDPPMTLGAVQALRRALVDV